MMLDFIFGKDFVKKDWVGYILKGGCAQIVPVMVKYFQTFSNETKSVSTAGQQSLAFRIN